jgi:hypothetical protein
MCERPNRKRTCGGIRATITACKYRITSAGRKFKKGRGREKNECQSGGYEFFTIGTAPTSISGRSSLSLIYFGESSKINGRPLNLHGRHVEREWVSAGWRMTWIYSKWINLFVSVSTAGLINSQTSDTSAIITWIFRHGSSWRWRWRSSGAGAATLSPRSLLVYKSWRARGLPAASNETNNRPINPLVIWIFAGARAASGICGARREIWRRAMAFAA